MLRLSALLALAFGFGCGPVALVAEDAGVAVQDAGPSDGGERFDAGELDAGMPVDAGAVADASVPGSWRQRVIYLVMPDRFVNGDPSNDEAGLPNCHDPASPTKFHGGDWAGVRQRLPYLSDLGVTAIWLTPANAQAARGCGYHGYWADLVDPDDGALEPKLGSAADLHGLIDDAHDAGVKVILDLVVNHAGRAARIATQRPTWFHDSATCGGLGDATVYCPLSGLPDFAQERPEVATYLDGMSARWVRSFPIDGIRMDTAKHVLRSYFRDRWFPAIRGVRPELFTVGEVYDESTAAALRPFLEAGFDSVFNFPLKRALTNCFARGGSVDEVANVVADDVAVLGLQRTLSLTSFLDNHDTPRFVSVASGTGDEVRAKTLLAFTALFTLPGIPQLYSGDELGVYGQGDPDNRRDFPRWGFEAPSREQPHPEAVPGAGALFRRVQALTALRTRSAVLAEGSYTELWRQNGAQNPNLFAFARVLGRETVIVVINASGQSVNADLRAPSVVTTIRHDEVLGDGASPLRLENGRLKLTIPARASAIYLSR